MGQGHKCDTSLVVVVVVVASCIQFALTCTVLENRWSIVANNHLPVGAIFVVSGAFVDFDSSGWFESHLVAASQRLLFITRFSAILL